MNTHTGFGTISTIKLKSISWETFQDYKNPGMLLATCSCDWKCLKEKNLDISICQNCSLAREKTIEIGFDKLYQEYSNNPITKSIIFGGLEPMLQFNEIHGFIKYFRAKTDDDVVIYTGYYPSEIEDKIKMLSGFSNIIVKFGRFDPDRPKIFDDILGVELASDNQFAVKIS